jgi:hypothetical protein
MGYQLSRMRLCEEGLIENEGSKSKASEDRGQGQCAVAAVQ